jgi:hypothetical protein
LTSVAFIMGVVPLVLASGPGAEAWQAMGIAVFAGMLGRRSLFLTPVFCVVVQGLRLDWHALGGGFRRRRAGALRALNMCARFERFGDGAECRLAARIRAARDLDKHRSSLGRAAFSPGDPAGGAVRRSVLEESRMPRSPPTGTSDRHSRGSIRRAPSLTKTTGASIPP